MQPWVTVYFFDIGHPCYGQMTKQGIWCPVSRDHIAGSRLHLNEVMFMRFLKLTANKVLVFDWIAGSCQVDLLKTGQDFSEAG